MNSWNSLTIAEQTFMRRALSEHGLAGSAQGYGTALRWAGNAEALQRSYTADEQRSLVPRLAAVALDLSDRGFLTIHQSRGILPRPTDEVMVGEELEQVLADPANWLWPPGKDKEFRLGAPQHVHEQWFRDAFPIADDGDLPGWDELSDAQRRILVCAFESSGMLTGPFGIWDEPLSGLDPAQRLEWVDRQLDPLVPFVRDGWIEVQHYPDASSDAMTVIPLEGLSAALADPAVRSDDGDDYFVGVGCVFTFAGEAAWRGGWSKAWGSRLTFD